MIYDTKTQKQQVNASGVGTSVNPDVRVSVQNLLFGLFTKVPFASTPERRLKSGRLGVTAVPWTADGNNYYPIVVDVDKDLPADRAGLVAGDFILSIDGQSTLNKPDSEFDRLIAGEAGQERTLTINRGTETKTVKLIMIPRT